MVPKAVLDYIDAGQQAFVEELLEWLRIPSVSTSPAHVGDVLRAAQWVADQAERLGFQTEVCLTPGHPLVFADRCPHADRPTLLIYGHYDVQPSEPDGEWLTPPFSPSIRDGYVYARGASDDKGQFFTYLKAMEAILAAEGELPLNVKLLVEGEEEIGSASLPPFLKERTHLLKADAIAISDGSQLNHDVPAITYGLRGLAYLQVDVQGPRFDVHSGGFGGLVANPVQALAQILSELKRPDGSVAIPGFYDDVLELTPAERQAMASLPFDENGVKVYLGIREFVGEEGFTLLERKAARPTLDVNGIWGGFSGEGSKTIIPARAGAKVSMRLVPNQTTGKVNRLFRDYVLAIAPRGVKVGVKELSGADPVLVSRDHPAVQAAARAIQFGFGKPPAFIREGGSIPVVGLFKDVLGMEAILMLGWGSPDDGAHSPNEKFNLIDFHRGMRAVAALLYELAS